MNYEQDLEALLAKSILYQASDLIMKISNDIVRKI